MSEDKLKVSNFEYFKLIESGKKVTRSSLGRKGIAVQMQKKVQVRKK